MTKQTKYISLAEFKAISDGPGGWEGYLSKTGEIDDGGDLVAQGAYKDTIAQFLTRGFNADSHGWRFADAIGFPTDAKEDDMGLYTRSQYHSTPDAQAVRVKVNERIAAGKGVYMSIGYEPGAAPIWIEPQDYAEKIPQYSRPDMVDANLLKALQFPVIRVLPKVNLFEGSIVSVPMLRSAEVTQSKSEGPRDGLTLEEHSHSVLAAVKEYADREADLTEIRRKEGRPISEARRTRIAKVLDALTSLDEIRDELRALLDETAPKDTEKQASINAVMNYLQVIDLQLRGVPIK